MSRRDPTHGVRSLSGPALPSPPTGLTTGVSGRTVTVAWTPPVTGGLPAGFQVEAGSTPGGVIGVFMATTARIVVPDAPAGTFYVRVRAVNAAGVSAATPEAVVVVQ